jgi:hypothetical protein
MNDMAYMCEFAVADAGGLAATDVVELNAFLRRNINRPRGYRRPVDLAAEWAATRS